jgi:hypothetical protein
MIDSLDNLKIPEKSKIRNNPYYEEIIKNGFSIAVHYSPEDVADIISGKLKFDFDLLEHDPDELAAFERYRQAKKMRSVG